GWGGGLGGGEVGGDGGGVVQVVGGGRGGRWARGRRRLCGADRRASRPGLGLVLPRRAPVPRLEGPPLGDEVDDVAAGRPASPAAAGLRSARPRAPRGLRLSAAIRPRRAPRCRGPARRPRDPDRLAEMGDALLQANSAAAAVGAFEDAVRARPGDPALLTRLGLALRRAGRAPEARARLEEALRLDPRQDRAYFGLGELALDVERFDDAVRDYERSLAIEPNYAPAHRGAGVSYALRGELEAAIRHFTEAVRLHPDSASIANLERARADLRRR